MRRLLIILERTRQPEEEIRNVVHQMNSITVNPRLSATIGPARIMADKRDWRLIKGA